MQRSFSITRQPYQQSTIVVNNNNEEQQQQQQQQQSQQAKSKRRRIIPLREPFKLTENAARRVLELIANKKGAIGLKVGMTRRGCNGLTTTLDYVYENNVPKLYEEVTDKGVKVYVDPDCLMFVIGTTMDYVEDEVRSEFIFNNPNAKNQCGCGDSVSIPEKVALANQKAIQQYHSQLRMQQQQSLPENEDNLRASVVSSDAVTRMTTTQQQQTQQTQQQQQQQI